MKPCIKILYSVVPYATWFSLWLQNSSTKYMYLKRPAGLVPVSHSSGSAVLVRDGG